MLSSLLNSFVLLVSWVLVSLHTAGAVDQNDSVFFAGASIADVSPEILPAIYNGSFVERSPGKARDLLFCVETGNGNSRHLGGRFLYGPSRTLRSGKTVGEQKAKPDDNDSSNCGVSDK